MLDGVLRHPKAIVLDFSSAPHIFCVVLKDAMIPSALEEMGDVKKSWERVSSKLFTMSTNLFMAWECIPPKVGDPGGHPSTSIIPIEW